MQILAIYLTETVYIASFTPYTLSIWIYEFLKNDPQKNIFCNERFSNFLLKQNVKQKQK